ncbi:Glycogen debranching enzyme (alpha-1,6-glucosidase) [Micromonospora phaseoli]|uniref:Glycogen debranching enzyme (Alpha-1,6-glucosidase) n=1 Tax=Micromonospora phaseoli TaxID=1144548 RepID=A0A1H6YEX0_9ACTN|nr:glycogen debranching N-terminal domain-containing protein [Micromonospora phaseoli]PZW00170.1 glycogen debranching enzyme [Micromonospora phaseoli]GIJ78876.1 aminotransferase [Micromonospora phaseoli]SEJ39828.1 Glycogen debranching enzyme (alpha-1,6-glucosidase) [Micromonospora phaseoli]
MKKLVRILDGNIFALSEDNGDMAFSLRNPSGFFAFDTRFLSTWRLRLDGERLHPLAVHEPSCNQIRFFLVPGSPTHYVDAKVSVIRDRWISGSAFIERLTLLNHTDEPVDHVLRIDADSDFAPVYQVVWPRDSTLRGYREVSDDCLRLGYRRDKFHRVTDISTSEPADLDERGLTFRVRLDRQGKWGTTLQVKSMVLRPDGQDVRSRLRHPQGQATMQLRHDLGQWLDEAPRLHCDWEPLTMTYRRGLVDLAGLRFSPLALPHETMLAAGLPWSATIIGRDNILTCFQTLPFVPRMAATTLRLLALDQGTVLDDFRDEEPGKMLNEFRYGEMAAFEERPQSPYFGGADVTPLFLVLLDEYERWTGDAALVRDLEEASRAALHWIDEYGDLRGDGYLWYQPRNERSGAQNHGWKDSPEAICYRDGRLPGLPRATCELQGYAYDAKLRGARLARQFWGDPAYADRLEREAAQLKERFNRDFWIDGSEYYALALGPDGDQVDALASNMGHLLWSGIVDESRAAAVAAHLLGPRLFSGWGVRTLATGQVRYNPLGYHVGTVWPFDNSLIALGLRRYGFVKEAGIIAEALIGAAPHFAGRMPEAFAGYDRDLTRYPVPYPAANSPQAAATGATFLLLRTLLGMEPYGEHLVVQPAIPPRFGRIELLDIPGRWGRKDAIGNARAATP